MERSPDLKCKQETLDVPSSIWGSFYLENGHLDECCQKKLKIKWFVLRNL